MKKKLEKIYLHLHVISEKEHLNWFKKDKISIK